MGLAPTSICECGALDQTAAHVIVECPLLLHRAPEDIINCWPRMTRLEAGSTKSPPTFEEDLSKEEDVNSKSFTDSNVTLTILQF